MKISLLLLLILNIISFSARADDNGTNGRNPALGAFLGNTLPSGVEGVTEIFPQWGVRYSQPVGRTSRGGGGTYIEGGFLAGRGDGVRQWQDVFASYSMHVPFESLVAHAGIGLDVTHYETDAKKGGTSGGGHFIGGVMSKIGDGSYVRFDMKLNSKPGTSLYFAIGLVIEIESSQAQNGQ